MKLMVICCISAMISGFPANGAARAADPGQGHVRACNTAWRAGTEIENKAARWPAGNPSMSTPWLQPTALCRWEPKSG